MAVSCGVSSGAGVNAPPASYTIGGKQYIVVAAGGNVQIDAKRGNSILLSRCQTRGCGSHLRGDAVAGGARIGAGRIRPGARGDSDLRCLSRRKRASKLPENPILAGQQYYYLYLQLKDFKSARARARSWRRSSSLCSPSR